MVDNSKKPNISTDKLIALYESGLTTSQIGTKVGMWKTSVGKRLKKAGVILKRSKDYSGKQRYWLWKGEDYIDPVTRKRNQRLHRKWSLAVRNRDENCCTECGVKDIRLEAHHIVNLRECINTQIEFDISNGITLCSACHKKIHRKI